MNSSGPTRQLKPPAPTRDAGIKVWCNVGLRWETRAAARSQGIAEPNGVARGRPEARGQIATGPLGTNSLLVDMPNDDAAPVNVGADAASQLHIVEKDYGHALLAPLI